MRYATVFLLLLAFGVAFSEAQKELLTTLDASLSASSVQRAVWDAVASVFVAANGTDCDTMLCGQTPSSPYKTASFAVRQIAPFTRVVILGDAGPLIDAGITDPPNGTIIEGRSSTTLPTVAPLCQCNGSSLPWLNMTQSDLRVSIRNIRIDGCSASGIYVANGQLVLTDMTISNNLVIGDGGGLYVAGGFVFASGQLIIEGNQAMTDVDHYYARGGGIFLEGGSMLMSDGVFMIQDNVAKSDGAGMYISSGQHLSVQDGCFLVQNNTARGTGGGISVFGSMRMSNGTFRVEDNNANVGGGIYAGGSTTMSNGMFWISGNSALVGGAIYGIRVTMTNGSFWVSNNFARAYGGGLATIGTTIMQNGSFWIQNNSALQGGGGMYLAGSDLKMLSGSFWIQDNSAVTGAGGGVYVDSLSSLTLGNGSIVVEHNTADGQGDGGGICVDRGKISVNSGCELWLKDNVAALRGGGLYLPAFSEIVVDPAVRIVFDNNVLTSGALDGGSSLFVDSVSVTFHNTVFRNHQYLAAGAFGGAASFVGSAFVELVDCLFENNTVALGGSGGALFTSADNLHIRRTVFGKNRASFGLAVYMRRGNFSCTDCLFRDHSYLDGEGTIFVASGHVSLTRSNFSTNNVPFGAGLSITSGQVFIADSRFINGTAQTSAGRGAAIFLKGGSLLVVGSEFWDNVSPTGTIGGSAVFITGGSSFWNSCSFARNSVPNGNGTIQISAGTHTFSSSLFSGNDAGSAGVFMLVHSLTGMLYVENCTFTDNVASLTGGAFVLTTSSNVTLKDLQFSRNRASYGAVFGLEQSGAIPTDIVFESCLFSDNNGVMGGAVGFLWMDTVDVGLRFADCMYYNNQSPYGPIMGTPPVSLLLTSPVDMFWGTQIDSAVTVFDAFGQSVRSDPDYSVFSIHGPAVRSNIPIAAPLFNGSASVLAKWKGSPVEGPISLQVSVARMTTSLIVHVLPCPPGFGYDVLAAECQTCDDGVSYKTRSSWSDCYACPSSDEATCTSAALQWNEGFWIDLSGSEPFDIYRCDPALCRSGGRCAPHRDPHSVLCGTCEPQFSEWNAECIPCSSPDFGLVFGALVLSFLFVCLQHILAQSSSAALRILFNFVQASVLFVYPRQWFAGQQLFSIDVVAPGVSHCPFARDGFDIFLTRLLYPFVLFCVLGVLFGGFRVMTSMVTLVPATLRKLSALPAFRRTVLVLALFSYQSLVETSFAFVNCRKVGSAHVVAVEPSISCESAEYRAWLPFYVVFLISLCLAPLALLCCLWRQRHHIQLDRAHMGIVVEVYRPEMFFWEVVILGRKLLLSIVFVIFTKEADLDVRRMSLGIVGTLFLCLHLIWVPYALSVENIMESSSLVCIVLLSLSSGTLDDKIQQWDLTLALFYICFTVLAVAVLWKSVQSLKKAWLLRLRRQGRSQAKFKDVHELTVVEHPPFGASTSISGSDLSNSLLLDSRP